VSGVCSRSEEMTRRMVLSWLAAGGRKGGCLVRWVLGNGGMATSESRLEKRSGNLVRVAAVVGVV
jgi:hypothetical protein